MSDLRGSELAMVFQDPMSSLNPVVPIGTQVTEVLLRHQDVSRAEARDEAEDLLRRCGIPDPRRRLREYPHQLSGGMRQRALIAIALACKPALLICDEPTTALDVTIQAQVLELLKELVNDLGTAMVMITHDLGVVAGLCDFVNVMYAGRIVESAPPAGAVRPSPAPLHRGAAELHPAAGRPRGEALQPIPGTPRDTVAWSKACAFAPRCPHADDACVARRPGAGADGPQRPPRTVRAPGARDRQTPSTSLRRPLTLTSPDDGEGVRDERRAAAASRVCRCTSRSGGDWCSTGRSVTSARSTASTSRWRAGRRTGWWGSPAAASRPWAGPSCGWRSRPAAR